MGKRDQDSGGIGARIKFARNAALFSGVIAAGGVILALVQNEILYAILPGMALLMALCGVMIWARKERDLARHETPRTDGDVEGG
jgi:hypothetical protein